MIDHDKTLWISWEKHRRTREICNALDIHLIECVSEKKGFAKYPALILRTFNILRNKKPHLVLTQNPSYVLNLLVIILKIFFGFKLVVDQHNEGVEPYIYDNKLYNLACVYIQRSADLNIVTNNALVDIVEANGGRAICLFDKLPVFNVARKIELSQRFNLVFICTFAPDEPYVEVIEAAGELQDKLTCYITGNHDKSELITNMVVPGNIEFTGFLPESDFINLLYSCDAIIDLTMMDNCLVCGAYEAVSLFKPLITSNTEALRNLFSRGVIYADNNKDSLKDAMLNMLDQYEKLNNEMVKLNSEISSEWEVRKDQFVQTIGSIIEQK